MTDQDQAARLAAIRAKRGQAPAAMPVTRQQPVQAGHEMWAAPLESAARPAPVAAMIAAKPAPTRRTAVQADHSPVARKKRQHAAAGARIVMTGVTASAVFGLTTVIAAANQPAATPAATTVPPGAVLTPDPTATVATTLPAAGVPGEAVVLSIPGVGDPAITIVGASPTALEPPAAVPGQHRRPRLRGRRSRPPRGRPHPLRPPRPLRRRLRRRPQPPLRLQRPPRPRPRLLPPPPRRRPPPHRRLR